MKLSLLLEGRKRMAAMHHSMLKAKEPDRQREHPIPIRPSLAKKISAPTSLAQRPGITPIRSLR